MYFVSYHFKDNVIMAVRKATYKTLGTFPSIQILTSTDYILDLIIKSLLILP